MQSQASQMRVSESQESSLIGICAATNNLYLLLWQRNDPLCSP